MSDAHRRRLVLIAAAHLRVGARRLRALARGDDGALREWIANESGAALARARAHARADDARLTALGARFVALSDAAYPAPLLELTDPPPFLTVLGTDVRGGVAIIGSRDGNQSALTFAYELARALGEPVIAGLARGVDAAAHTGALDAGIATVAYVGTGIGVTYPAEHAALQQRIVASGGAIISERLPDEVVSRWALVRRDRLQAAHARAVVLVASDRDGGAMHTMRYARLLGRPRFVLEDAAMQLGDGNAVARAEGAVPLPFDVARACMVMRDRASSSSPAGDLR